MIALQQGPGPFEDLDWLVQVAVVAIFFVLPLVRTLLERKKRGESARSAKRPKPTEKGTRDLWKELLEGKAESRAPDASATKTVPPSAPPAVPRAPAEGSRSASRRARPVPRVTPAKPSVPAPPPERRTPRPEVEFELGGDLTGSFAGSLTGPDAAPSGERLSELDDSLVNLEGDSRAASVGRRAVKAAATRRVDPGTLDEEIGERWSVSEAPGAERVARRVYIGGVVDWHRVVLFSELLAPPLALRGPSAAWPGPPAALEE